MSVPHRTHHSQASYAQPALRPSAGEVDGLFPSVAFRSERPVEATLANGGYALLRRPWMRRLRSTTPGSARTGSRLVFRHLNFHRIIERAARPRSAKIPAYRQGVARVRRHRDGHVRVGNCLPMGGIESTPASTGKIYFRPGMQMTTLTPLMALLVAAGEACGNSLSPTAVDE
jgi:hypothetical protein